jgi:hypothetical protein
LSDERVERRAAVRAADVAAHSHLMVADERNTAPVLQDMAARTELHSIDTLTLEAAQAFGVLRGEGKACIGHGKTPTDDTRAARSLSALPASVQAKSAASRSANSPPTAGPAT